MLSLYQKNRVYLIYKIFITYLIAIVSNLVCPNLTNLSLANLGLIEVPTFIQQLSYLNILNLPGNNLLHLPTWIGALPLKNIDVFITCVRQYLFIYK